METEISEVLSTQHDPHLAEAPENGSSQAQPDDWEELNRVAESIIHTLDRLHLIAQEVVGDLRAARQELTKERDSHEPA